MSRPGEPASLYWRKKAPFFRKGCFCVFVFLLNARRQQRAFRVRRVRVTFLDLPNYPVKIDLIARNDDYHVARAVLLLVDRKFDDGRVPVFLCDRFVFKSVGVVTDRLTKCYFYGFEFYASSGGSAKWDEEDE